jgi:hypothetical protein
MTNQEYEKNNSPPDLDDKNIIFVTLRYSKARELIEKANKNKARWWDRLFAERDTSDIFPLEGVKVVKAPEPDEIKWENIGFPKKVKFCRKIIIYSLAMVLIGITLAISIALGSFQSDSKQFFISILISIVITLINFLIEMLIILVSYF